jgi:hypothetical protein
VTRDECRDFSIWYLNTYIYLRGFPLYVREVYDSEEGSNGNVEIKVRAKKHWNTEEFFVKISSMSEVSPIPLRPRMVDSGTVYGQVYVSRTPRRQYRKSISPRDMLVNPMSSSVDFYTVAENYVHKPPQYYTLQEAAERVLSGTALWSAVSDKILIGAVAGSSRFVCSWKGRVVGTFALNKLGEPDVKKLTLTKPNAFLLDSISEVLGVACRANNR